MSDLLKSINERISSYQLFNFFYPGAIFLSILKYLQCDFVDSLSMWYFLLFSYFVEMTTSRIGSIVVEDLCVCFGCIKKHDYKKQTEAEKKDSKVMLLLEICNTYRTLSAMFAVLFVLSILNCLLGLNILKSDYCCGAIFFILFILFLVSFCKQYGYVEERIQANISE